MKIVSITKFSSIEISVKSVLVSPLVSKNHVQMSDNHKVGFSLGSAELGLKLPWT